MRDHLIPVRHGLTGVDTVQRGLNADPNALASSASSSSGPSFVLRGVIRLIVPSLLLDPSAESAMLISSLRDVIRTQATEIDTLQAQLNDLATRSSEQVRPGSHVYRCR